MPSILGCSPDLTTNSVFCLSVFWIIEKNKITITFYVNAIGSATQPITASSGYFNTSQNGFNAKYIILINISVKRSANKDQQARKLQDALFVKMTSCKAEKL